MVRMVSTALLAVALIVPAAAVGQTPEDEAQTHLANARKLAGMQFITTEETQCSEIPRTDPYGEPDKDDRVTPTRVFDNVYYVGTRTLGTWVVATGDSLVLIDAMHTKWVKSTLLDGMKKLKLDPSKVAYVIVTQGIGKDYGGAKYFQDTYGSQVVM
ncbi:MAG: hypothetical protein ACREL5_09815, partial [Gemmatimonadales bacterium]